MCELDLLTTSKVFGDEKLEFFKTYGVKCAATDFTLLLGGIVDKDYTSEGETLKDRSIDWWLKNKHGTQTIRIISKTGELKLELASLCHTGVRPAIKYSEIAPQITNEILKDSLLEVEYGEYPQTIVQSTIQEELTKRFAENKLVSTGKSYTYMDSEIPDEDIYGYFYEKKELIEYEYQGKKYVQFITNFDYSIKPILSNGKVKENYTTYWLEVEPIKWLVDKEADIALTKKAVFSGVEFGIENNKSKNFLNSEIKKFLDEHFAKDIKPSKTRYKKHNETEEKRRGIKVKDINIEKIQEIELKREKEERPKVKRK